MTDGARGVFGVYLLAVYVIDDTDFWSDGEIYWWTIPALETKSGITWSATYGLPNGAPPHKCGDLEWMTNIALKDPPLLAVIPPADADVVSSVIRVAVYDDDGAIADFPKAMAAGYEALSQCKQSGLTGSASIVTPVRDAIFKSLKGDQDDILVEQDLQLLRGDALLRRRVHRLGLDDEGARLLLRKRRAPNAHARSRRDEEGRNRRR